MVIYHGAAHRGRMAAMYALTPNARYHGPSLSHALSPFKHAGFHRLFGRARACVSSAVKDSGMFEVVPDACTLFLDWCLAFGYAASVSRVGT